MGGLVRSFMSIRQAHRLCVGPRAAVDSLRAKIITMNSDVASKVKCVWLFEGVYRLIISRLGRTFHI